MSHELTSLQRAVDLSGGQAGLAKRLSERKGLGIKQGHVWYWLNKSKRVPAEYAVPVEEITDGQVSRYDLRPDVFGAPPDPTHGRAA
jgi:DNA-binding transcriptional regulator YdaS (Cro superfamily)